MPMTPEEAKACITLLLTTCPHPCRLRKLLRDFRKLKGHNMPLFGFDSHLELLKSFSDIVMVLDSGNERNPEIRLIRRDPLGPQRARDIFPGLDDEREIDSFLPLNGPKIHNPTLPNVLILQDEAAAYVYSPEPLDHDHEERVQPEDFATFDDGIGEGVEEEEHVHWNVEREMSASFLMRLCVQWLLESLQMIWHKFTHSFGWFGNKK